MNRRPIKTACFAVAGTLLYAAASLAQLGPTTVRATITFSKNTDASLTSVCVSQTVPSPLLAQRKQTIIFTLQNATGTNACPGYTPANVLLEFKSDVATKRRVHGLAAGAITVKVTSSAITAPDNTKHRYDVYYNNLLAEDPEIDVNGDCGGCRPK
jgi:hypothetical protein